MWKFSNLSHFVTCFMTIQIYSKYLIHNTFHSVKFTIIVTVMLNFELTGICVVEK